MDYLSKAIELGRIALQNNEVPVGAVVVMDNTIIGEGFNRKETLKDPSAHAEVIAIKDACSNICNWRLSNCTLYVSLEPCPMCASLITQSRIGKVVIACPSYQGGAFGTVIDLSVDPQSSYTPEIIWDLRQDAVDLMDSFFKFRRNQK